MFGPTHLEIDDGAERAAGGDVCLEIRGELVSGWVLVVVGGGGELREGGSAVAEGGMEGGKEVGGEEEGSGCAIWGGDEVAELYGGEEVTRAD